MEEGTMYSLQEVPGKGKGLVATKDIAEGTRILEEKPAVTVPTGQKNVEWLKKHVSQQVDALDEDQRRSFLSMHNFYPHEADADTFLGIFRTNGLPIENGRIERGIFLEACRINHSCDNNAQKQWNQRTERHTVHASRDISEGEEITVYYLGLDSIRGIRQRKLLDKFGFLCSCRLCSLAPKESQESDQRLERIDRLDDIVGRECTAMRFSLQTLRYVDERVQL